jgi:hypothetical protein
VRLWENPYQVYIDVGLIAMSFRTRKTGKAAQLPASKKACKNSGQNWTLCCKLSSYWKLKSNLQRRI